MRKASMVLVSALSTLLLTVTPAFAGDATIVFGHPDEFESGVVIGDSCVAGRAPGSSALHLVWKSAAGAVKANTDVETGFGFWKYCSDTGATVAAGDRFKATVGGYVRKFTVPLLTITVDRVDDNYRGRAPAGSDVTLWYIYTGCCPDYVQHEDLTADADGNWLFSNYDYPVDGYEAWIQWHSAKGDTVSNHDVAPSVTATLGKSIVSGSALPRGKQIKIVLRDGATGDWKAVAETSVGEYGRFTGVFRNAAGQPVVVHAGDRVVGTTLASDMRFVVGEIEGAADVDTDVVTGRCGNGRGGEVTVLRRGNWIGRAFMDVDEQGYFTVWFGDEETLGYDPANIRSGDKIKVTCRVPRGDWIVRSFIVP